MVISFPHRVDRFLLTGADGDALNGELAAAGYNIRWLLRTNGRGTF